MKNFAKKETLIKVATMALFMSTQMAIIAFAADGDGSGTTATVVSFAKTAVNTIGGGCVLIGLFKLFNALFNMWEAHQGGGSAQQSAVGYAVVAMIAGAAIIVVGSPLVGTLVQNIISGNL